MKIKIVTETEFTHSSEVLAQNAIRLILEALGQYDADYDEHDLVKNITKTLQEQQNN